MMVETLIEDVRWQELELEKLAIGSAKAVSAFKGLSAEFEICVLGCDDARIAALNADFRGKEAPTNVLSWPSAERAAATPGEVPQMPEVSGDLELGDVAIAYETCAREARETGKSLQDHTSHLLVHGILHLLGYDHENDADAALMEQTEVKILGKLGVSNPY